MDTGSDTLSFASEIISSISIRLFQYLKNPPVKLTMPDIPN